MVTVSLESFNEKQIQNHKLIEKQTIWKERYNDNGLVAFSYSHPSCRKIKNLNKLDSKSVLWVPYLKGKMQDIKLFHPDAPLMLEKIKNRCYGYLLFRTEANELAIFVIYKFGVIEEYIPENMTSLDYMYLAELFCHMVLTFNHNKYTICPPEVVLRNVFFYLLEEDDGSFSERIRTHDLLQTLDKKPEEVRHLMSDVILDKNNSSRFFINQYRVLMNPETLPLLPRKAMFYKGEVIRAPHHYLLIGLNNYFYEDNDLSPVMVHGFCFEGIIHNKNYIRFICGVSSVLEGRLLTKAMDQILGNNQYLFDNILISNTLHNQQKSFPWRDYHIAQPDNYISLILMVLKEISYSFINLSKNLIDLDKSVYPSYIPLSIFSSSQGLKNTYELILQYIENSNESIDVISSEEEAIFNKDCESEEKTIPILYTKLIGDDESLDGWKFLNDRMPLKFIDQTINPQDVYNKLIEEFPYLKEPSLYVVQRLALCQKYNRPFSFAPILLDGAPGIGKTRWAKKVSEYCNSAYSFHSLSGVSSSMGIIGSERGWKSARPGFWAFTLRETMIANPVVVMDELDKLGTGTQNGSAQAALLPFLEKETSKKYKDIFFMTDVNTSYFSYVFTSNNISDVSEALQSRLKLFKCRKPTQKEIDTIFSNILNDIINEIDIDKDDIQDIDFSSIQARYSQHESIRILKAEIENKIMHSIFSVADTNSNGNSFDKKTIGFMAR